MNADRGNLCAAVEPRAVIRCPRCHREAARTASLCSGCGAPLVLGDEMIRPLDGALELDRRGARGIHAAAPALADEALLDVEVDALEVHVERAPPWRRIGAWAADAVPFVVGAIALGRALLREATAGAPPPSSGIDALLDLVVREKAIALSVAAAVTLALAVYATLAHTLAGATLGKWAFRLRVVGPDGEPPSPARSAARSALALGSAALLGLGFLLVLFTRSGRALHDIIARTWVVKAP